MKYLDIDRLPELTVQVSQMTTQNFINALEKEQELSAKEKENIKLIASVAATTVANFLLCLQQEGQHYGQPDQILPQ